MPELPEVETTRRGIAPAIEHEAISAVIVRNPSLRWPVPPDLAERSVGKRVQAVTRRGKYLLLDLGDGFLILHLGMSGSLRVVAADSPAEKHDHVDLVFGKQALRLRDPRRFGALLWQPGIANVHPLLASLGPEPLGSDFTPEILFQSLQRRHCAVKIAIMDSKLVVGVGNIYASESLFRAGILPLRAASSVRLAECMDLHAAIRQTLQAAIEAGGSTLRDFVDSSGKPGYFQQQYFVYDRAEQPCLRCGSPIRSSRLGQRSTYWCINCQH